MSVLPQWIYKISTISVKILVGFFVEINKLILKYIGKCKGPKVTETILKKNKIGGLTLRNFKTDKLQN